MALFHLWITINNLMMVHCFCLLGHLFVPDGLRHYFHSLLITAHSEYDFLTDLWSWCISTLFFCHPPFLYFHVPSHLGLVDLGQSYRVSRYSWNSSYMSVLELYSLCVQLESGGDGPSLPFDFIQMSCDLVRVLWFA